MGELSMQYIKFENFINSTQYGYTAETTSPISGDAKYLRITDIVPYFVEKDRVPYCAIDASKVNKYLVHDGDVLIARTGATTGYNLVVDDSFKNYVFASYLIRFNYDRKKLHPRYLKYVLKSPSWYGFVNNYIGGSAQPGMNARVFGKYYLPYTDFSTQQKIASILSAYDALIENNKKRIKLLEQMAEDLYKEWFVRFRFPGYETAEFEGGVPKGWKRVSLREYANVIMGQSPESCFYNTEKLGLPFHQGCGSYGEFYLRDDIYSTEGKRIAEPNSIIFSVRAPVGRINLTLNKIILGRGVAGINAKNNNNAFLLWLLKQKFSKEDIIGNGAIFTSVTKNELLGQKLLIPNKELERKFNIIASNIETEIKLLTLQKEVLTTQRDLLLPRLMSGKLSI